jgi:hypothetical protein
LFNPEFPTAVSSKWVAMENSKQKDLEILIAVSSHQTTPADEFHRIFEYHWLNYRKNMISLYNEGFFVAAHHDTIQGLTNWKLTGAGKNRIEELLLERSNDISKKHFNLTASRETEIPASMIKTEKVRTFPVWQLFSGIFNLVSHLSVRIRRPVH